MSKMIHSVTVVILMGLLSSCDNDLSKVKLHFYFNPDLSGKLIISGRISDSNYKTVKLKEIKSKGRINYLIRDNLKKLVLSFKGVDAWSDIQIKHHKDYVDLSATLYFKDYEKLKTLMGTYYIHLLSRKPDISVNGKKMLFELKNKDRDFPRDFDEYKSGFLSSRSGFRPNLLFAKE